MITFGVQQFRCFFRPKPIRLGKITLLVGENSAGKTSFLAALRASFETFKMQEPDFNQAPFNLGAYDQIAHYRNRIRAKEFSFEFSQEPTDALLEQAEKLYPAYRKRFDRVRGRITFIKKSGQPAISTITITFGVVSISLFLLDKERLFSVRAAGRVISVTRNEVESMPAMAPGFSEIQRFYYLFYHIFTNKEMQKKEKQRDEKKMAEGGLFQSMIQNAMWMFGRFDLEIAAPIRTKPRRTYDPKSERPDPEGEHIPYLLARLNAEKSEQWASLKAALTKFGSAAGLFDEIEIKRKGSLDSDPFQLLVKSSSHSSNLIDVGYGVSQVLPLLTEIILAQKETVHLIQQPEVHLHPRAQAEFASFLKDFFSSSPSYCFVETHSDFIVDRIRSHIAKGELKKEDVSLIFFERKEKHVDIFQIELDGDGNISAAPRGYRNFFQKEILRTLGAEDVLSS